MPPHIFRIDSLGMSLRACVVVVVVVVGVVGVGVVDGVVVVGVAVVGSCFLALREWQSFWQTLAMLSKQQAAELQQEFRTHHNFRTTSCLTGMEGHSRRRMSTDKDGGWSTR